MAAPTGSGKTVVGEFAVHLALAEGRKCFYTTPIKALSNQKYNDLVKRYGAAKVGLLTGDNSVNGEAPIVIMTTEVLRNMLYAGSGTLAGLGFVVMDEVHYLADRFRGAVWEEVIIHLPESVRLVALSATVSNAEEFGEWLGTVRGDTSVIVDEHRPVPLWQHMLVGHRLYDLFLTEEDGGRPLINPNLLRMARDEERQAYGRGRRGYARPRRPGPPNRAEAIERLDADGLLPAITFIFSRAGCDAAVLQCLHAGIRLTTDDERHEIRQIVDERTAHLPDEDLAVLGYLEWRDCLERGLAAHHAGMLPTFKEVVEELFTRGLVKAVFATETLALGINMPARSVVIEKLDKWNGETHADLTPASTPSSPAGPGAAASTSRATRWCSGSRAWTRCTSRAWPAPAPTRCAPASAPPTTWPSTSSARSAGSGPEPCWSPPSRSSRRTGRWSASPSSCAGTRRRWRATARR
nr:hypothetical protein GCM10020093_026020 [Planobispora longispora]